jgi:septum site-determining protein MinC
MNSDPTIPNLKSDSAAPNAESNPATVDAESNAVIPDTELNSVLEYLHPNSDILDIDDSELIPLENRINNNIQIQFKSEEERLVLILPPESQAPVSEYSWSEISQQIKLRLLANDRLRIPDSTVHLITGDRLLDGRQLQELAETLSEVQLHLKSVSTSRRQTAIAAVSAGYSVEQVKRETSLNLETKTAPTPLADALYLEMTVRSGVEIRHPGTVIILGDVNPGGIVVADGDILVWGRLRGIAHAGATGNRQCLIMSLQMEPTQLRIADAVARAPEKSPTQWSPEVAHITPQGIRIARAIDFSRSQLGRIDLKDVEA